MNPPNKNLITIISTPERQRIVVEGYSGYAKGCGISDNPYAVGLTHDPRVDLWHEGYLLAKQDDEVGELSPTYSTTRHPVGWIYVSNYIPNPQVDDGFRFTRDKQIAENNAVPGTIKSVYTEEKNDG